MLHLAVAVASVLSTHWISLLTRLCGWGPPPDRGAGRGSRLSMRGRGGGARAASGRRSAAAAYRFRCV